MSKVKGENVIVYFFDNPIWKMYACALSASLTVNTEVLETSEVGAGTFATFRPTKDSFEGSLTGLVALNLANTYALSDLRSKQLLHTKLLMRFQRTDNDLNVYTDEGFFWITKTSDEGAIGSMNSFSIDLKGTGTLTPIFTPTPTNLGGIVQISYYSGTGGESTYTALGFITGTALINKQIVGAEKDGIGYKIILTGTPVNKEVLYNIATGQVTWSVPFEPGEVGFLQYQDI